METGFFHPYLRWNLVWDLCRSAHAGALYIHEMGIRHDLFQRMREDADTGQRLQPLTSVAAKSLAAAQNPMEDTNMLFAGSLQYEIILSIFE